VTTRLGVQLLLGAGLVLVGACASTPPDPSTPATLPPVDAWHWTVIEPIAPVESFDQIAVGPAGMAATTRPTGIWTSLDGESWVGRGQAKENDAFTDVVAGSEGAFVAVGFRPDKGALFQRFDLSTADLAELDEGPLAAGDVHPSDRGYVAFGGRLANPGQAYTWSSSDGRQWSRADGPAEALLDPAARDANGWLAASNWSAPELGDGHVDLWRSTDTRTWDPSGTIVDAGVNGLVPATDGWIAVGGSSAGLHDLFATAWRSVDERSWKQVLRAPDTSTMAGVVRWRDGFVAFGSTIPGNGTRRRGLVWVSRDGATWSPVSGIDLENVTLADGDATDGRLVLVGSRGDGPVIFSVTLPTTD